NRNYHIARLTNFGPELGKWKVVENTANSSERSPEREPITHTVSAGRRRGERQVKDDELRPLLATLTTPAVKAVCGACAFSFFFIFPTRLLAVLRLCAAIPAVVMVKLSKEAKQRLQQLFKGGQFAIRWGFIPLVIYLGFKRGADPGMPEPTVLRYCS
ncbi:hypothetical protein MC885_006345, partial [Smutsia gigantea]